MPTFANITVKNGAATPADVTFVGVSPANGFGSTAWWNVIAGPARSIYTRFSAMVDRNKDETSIVKTKLIVPAYFVDPVTSVPTVLSRAEVNVDVRIPKNFPVSEIDNVAAYAGNLLSAALIKEAIKTGTPIQ